MFPKKLDILLAHKTINLMPELPGTDKRVAAAIIDHFNYRTAQCDPSLERLARLLGLSRRTVIRSISRIEKTGILRKVRHGGHLLRNSYEPVWTRFRELEAAWRISFDQAKRQRAAQSLSPEQCPAVHLSGVLPGTQTLSINQSKETILSHYAEHKPLSPNNPKRREERPIKERQNGLTEPKYPSAMRHREAARAAAERRWGDALNRCFATLPDIYAKVIEAVDENLQRIATELETKKQGAGIAFLFDELKKRDVELP